MKSKLLILTLTFILLSILFISCDNSSQGSFSINLMLPSIPTDVSETDDFGLVAGDEITVDIFKKATLSGKYEHVDTAILSVNKKSGSAEFARILTSDYYYKLLISVTNSNQKLKLTGVASDIFYKDTKDTTINVFMGIPGDFAQLVKNHSTEHAITTYIPEDGSFGSFAVGLKNGKAFVAGGKDLSTEEDVSTAMIVDSANTTAKKVKALPKPLQDAAIALLDDGTSTGKVIIAFGSSNGKLSNTVYSYDPKLNIYSTLYVASKALTYAKAISVGNAVYIVGGSTDLNGTTPSGDIYKVTGINGNITVKPIGSLKTPRFYHSISDVSFVDNKGVLQERVLVLGGVRKKNGIKFDFIKGTDFAEIITSKGVSQLPIYSLNSLDAPDANIMLALQSSTTLRWDNQTLGPKNLVLVAGGVVEDDKNGENGNDAIVNERIYAFREFENKWVYTINTASFKCAHPSMGNILAKEKSSSQYAVLNCGTSKINRTSAVTQQLYVLEARSTTNNDNYTITVSARTSSISNDNKAESILVDGPVASTPLGQAYVFGSQMIYLVSGYSINN